MAWSLTHAKLHTLLRRKILLPCTSRILMAVSGGQDSLCMARLLIDMQPHWDWQLGLVHCDHRWRDDSEANAAHVLQLAADWEVPAWCVVAERSLKSEAEARTWRYESIAAIAREQCYTHVTCGHTMSDRAETILYNLTRGAGIEGVATLPWQRPIDSLAPPVMIVRPLLNMSRGETGDFCQQGGIPVWEDSTNQSLELRRNRIRLELLPYLQKHFNPQVERSLAQFLETTAADVDYLESQTTSIYKEVVYSDVSTATWKIHLCLADQPLAIQRRVVKRVLRQAARATVSFSHVEKVVACLRSPNASQSDSLPNGYIAQVCKPFLIIKPLGSENIS